MTLQHIMTFHTYTYRTTLQHHNTSHYITHIYCNTYTWPYIITIHYINVISIAHQWDLKHYNEQIPSACATHISTEQQLHWITCICFVDGDDLTLPLQTSKERGSSAVGDHHNHNWNHWETRFFTYVLHEQMGSWITRHKLTGNIRH